LSYCLFDPFSEECLPFIKEGGINIFLADCDAAKRRGAEEQKVNYLYKPSISLTKEKERKGQTHETQQRIY
jgi:hypothetical protein